MGEGRTDGKEKDSSDLACLACLPCGNRFRSGISNTIKRQGDCYSVSLKDTTALQRHQQELCTPAEQSEEWVGTGSNANSNGYSNTYS